MPYIHNDERRILEALVSDNPGGLNYKITELCDLYLSRNGKTYATLNDIVGALECAKLEFYRRVAAPYEDTKRIINGDVYSLGNV